MCYCGSWLGVKTVTSGLFFSSILVLVIYTKPSHCFVECLKRLRPSNPCTAATETATVLVLLLLPAELLFV